MLGALSSVVKRGQGRDADHSTPYSYEAPLGARMALVGQLYFTFIIISKYKIRQYNYEDGNFYICRECEELGYLSLVSDYSLDDRVWIPGTG
jgi:hypothetical protein